MKLNVKVFYSTKYWTSTWKLWYRTHPSYFSMFHVFVWICQTWCNEKLSRLILCGVFDAFRNIKIRPVSVKTFDEVILENGTNKIHEVKSLIFRTYQKLHLICTLRNSAKMLFLWLSHLGCSQGGQSDSGIGLSSDDMKSLKRLESLARPQSFMARAWVQYIQSCLDLLPGHVQNHKNG